MSVQTRARVSRGIPSGGQFAAEAHPESSLQLRCLGVPNTADIPGLAADIRLTVNQGAHDEDAYLEMREARKRIDDQYGSAEQAVIAVGHAVASRAEELAGVTAEQVRASWESRLEAAQASYKPLSMRRPYDEEVHAAQQELSDVMCGRDAETKKDTRRLADGYLNALAEIRPMGGKVATHPGSSPLAVQHLQDAASVFPTEWIHYSNRHSEMLIERAPRRAHYRDQHLLTEKIPRPHVTRRAKDPDEISLVETAYGAWKPTGEMGRRRVRKLIDGRYHTAEAEAPVYERDTWDVIEPGAAFRAKKDGTPHGKGWEQWVEPETGTAYWRRRHMLQDTKVTGRVAQLTVGGRKVSYAQGREPDFAVAAHEFGHRSEYSIDGINKLENAFLRRRTLLDPESDPYAQEEMVALYGRTNEFARPDHFVDKYMGKHYDSGSTEIMSTGIESVFAGSHGGLIGVGGHREDHEMKAFVLGVLASAGGPKKTSGSGYYWD